MGAGTKKAKQEWREGLDPMEIPPEAELVAAEKELKEGKYDGSDVKYIAGISRRNPVYGGHSDQATALANDPLYRLAAIRLLAKEGRFDVTALQLYAWTGFQELLLPRNPLFALVKKGTYPLASLLDQKRLQRWLETASDDDLRAVQKWHSQFVETGDPELHEWYIKVLTRVGLERLQYILKVISDPEHLEDGSRAYAKKNVSRLTKAIAQCVTSKLEVSADGTVTSEGFFKTKLGEGLEANPES